MRAHAIDDSEKKIGVAAVLGILCMYPYHLSRGVKKKQCGPYLLADNVTKSQARYLCHSNFHFRVHANQRVSRLHP